MGGPDVGTSSRGLATVAVLAVAGCTSAGGSASASAAGGGSVAVTATPAAPSAIAVCARTAATGTLAVSIEDFEFKPAAIAARPGQVVTFTNTGFEHHTATLDAGGCGTETLETGGRDGLVFVTPGRYAYHCTVHAWMTGTIDVAG